VATAFDSFVNGRHDTLWEIWYLILVKRLPWSIYTKREKHYGSHVKPRLPDVPVRLGETNPQIPFQGYGNTGIGGTWKKQE
jgi:hypothetical protein